MKKYFVIIPAIILLFACNNGKDKIQKETKDSTEAIRANPVTNTRVKENEMKEIAASQKNKKPEESPYKNAKIDVVVIKNDTVKQIPKLTGFGYNILIYGAVYVHQPHIPAIPGNRGFNTKEQANKAAGLVVYKIRNNIMPPGLTVEELDSLGVLK